MKKQYVSLLAVILSVSGFLFSCHDKMNKNTGALQFDSIQVNETAHLFNDTAKPACNIIINFAYPVKSSDDMLKDSLNAYFISVCFGDKYIGEKPEAVVKQYAKNYIDEYRHDQEPMYAEDEKNKESDAVVGAWYSYYKSIESHVQLYEKDLLVYRVDYNEYTGGAHGIPKCKLEPYASAEIYNGLNKTEHFGVKRMRYRGGITLPLSERWEADIFYCRQLEKDKRKDIVGVECVYSF